MTTAMPLWTGREIRALRLARRMSVRAFAEHLGVSDRMVSKWEAGGTAIRPRPHNQSCLDTSLAMAKPDMKQRFDDLRTNDTLAGTGSLDYRPAEPPSTVVEVVRHPIDGKLMTLIPAGTVKPAGASHPIWLPAFYLDIHPTTNADYQQYLAATAPPTHPEPNSQDTAVGDSSSTNDLPVVNLGWHSAVAYADWADKQLPTLHQWKHAIHVAPQVTPTRMWEWTHTDTAPAKFGSRSHRGGFRTATPSTHLHALLAI